ncbi:hypothetical protein JW960_22330 [candidate division KSB1 bacterium]|nr:hypothetical protein [candidate division KSB1 bacterium]
MTPPKSVHVVIDLSHVQYGVRDFLMEEWAGAPALHQFIERVKEARLVETIGLHHCWQDLHDQILAIARKNYCSCYLNKETHLFHAIDKIAQVQQADGILLLSATCPLIDPGIVDRCISIFLDHSTAFDFISNGIINSFPAGNTVSLVNTNTLKTIMHNISNWRRFSGFNDFFNSHADYYAIHHLEWEYQTPYINDIRWNVTQPEDVAFLKQIFETLHAFKPNFGIHDVLKLLMYRPDLKLSV